MFLSRSFHLKNSDPTNSSASVYFEEVTAKWYKVDKEQELTDIEIEWSFCDARKQLCSLKSNFLIFFDKHDLGLDFFEPIFFLLLLQGKLLGINHKGAYLQSTRPQTVCLKTCKS